MSDDEFRGHQQKQGQSHQNIDIIMGVKRAAADLVKEKLNELITEKFDVDKLSLASNTVVHIADMGCAAGPSNFLAMGNLVRTIPANCSRRVPEFHVFFNDLPSKDFNALFAALPLDNNRGYFATGVADPSTGGYSPIRTSTLSIHRRPFTGFRGSQRRSLEGAPLPGTRLGSIT
ncbi:hypothetical protein MLD38_005434 [Melastoma candidum]|uniref:Uncharacterized protein n=1 Tax=Melastoma candidum TaxID=119954 RepID=A0ACB9RIY0_9MYRT|nr:hypothetical protein MLD38_005434 [Melastoma candidum]